MIKLNFAFRTFPLKCSTKCRIGRYALKAFEDSRIDDIVLVVGTDEETFCRNEIVEKYGFLSQKFRRLPFFLLLPTIFHMPER